MSHWNNAWTGDPENNRRRHELRLTQLQEDLDARGTPVEPVLDALTAFEVEIPSWGVGVGGTRFGRFPLPGMPTNLDEKLDDIAYLNRLTGAAGSVSLHIPWDEPKDPKAQVNAIAERDLRVGSVNSNTFQNQPGQAHSYRYGSLSHTDAAVRKQAIEHNRHVVTVGESLGAKTLVVWIADGATYPGQVHARRAFDRYVESSKAIHAGLPADWRMMLEHKPFEPAFHHSINFDWGSSYLAAQQTGDRCACLVDFGHHLPATPIDVIVARLISAGRLGGFHFNDRRYADDDLTAGSVAPFQLFQVFVELTMARQDPTLPGFNPGYMIDQSETVKDPLEALLQTVDALMTALAQSLVVDYDALFAAQEANDVMAAERCLQAAFRTDVGPLVAETRLRKKGALDPVAAFRQSNYRTTVAKERKTMADAAEGI